ncbi:hypothetical protein Misp05_61280 [Micromonospora sp. NBRC 107095]|nr:hypothetical protein Misp05_61280 [Micromonospora sp. NBRC 107095]
MAQQGDLHDLGRGPAGDFPPDEGASGRIVGVVALEHVERSEIVVAGDQDADRSAILDGESDQRLMRRSAGGQQEEGER